MARSQDEWADYEQMLTAARFKWPERQDAGEDLVEYVRYLFMEEAGALAES